MNCTSYWLLNTVLYLFLINIVSTEQVKNETFLTEEDYLRPLDDQEVVQLTDADFKNAELLGDEIIRQSRHHVLTQQKYFRGDIRGKAAWGLKGKEGIRRNGVVSMIKVWPSGRIPYVLSAQYNERERAVLARAFQEYQSKTCIRFVPKTAFDHDYLYIGKIDGCFSDVGRAGGRQELSLDDGCLQYDTAIHELMHSLGFYHEHERWDRDQFINIMWHNIDKDAYDQFGRVDLTESSYYGEAYDYHSIMHYDSMAFSKNGFETLMAKKPEMTPIMGSAIDFSPVDLTKIRKMYRCPDPDLISAVALSSMLNGGNTFAGPVLPQAVLPGAQPAPPAPPPQTSGVVVSPVQPVMPPVVVPGTPPIDNSILTRVNKVSTPTSENSKEVCADKTTLCWRWLDRCQSFFFEKIMKEFCALSCGYCTPPIPGSIAKPPSPPLAPPASPFAAPQAGRPVAAVAMGPPGSPNNPALTGNPVVQRSMFSNDPMPYYQRFG